MNIHRAAAIVLLGLSFTGTGLADTYNIDTRHTFPSFEISHLGFSTQRGRFNHTTGKIMLDAKNEVGELDVKIDANSIDTGLPELEAKLKSEEFFHVAQFPEISFNAKKVKFTGESPIAAEGVLTLHGVSKPVLLAITHFQCGMHPVAQRQVCGANATGQIKRSDFGINAFLPMVGDEVKIHIQVEAFKD